MARNVRATKVAGGFYSFVNEFLRKMLYTIK